MTTVLKKRKLSTKLLIKEERCKSCGICIEFCPRDALSYSGIINEKGYDFTEVDDDKCISCAICYTVCPDGVFDMLGKEK